ncbi:unnamed protein product [Allacma fusca]|uniref:Nucleolar protein 6 n=1 Tax=Allacma fusca TaxID=39272 RepID=A0A8J2PPP2_9HEXA|nr:unnamed protein product [Allacma fusca]
MDSEVSINQDQAFKHMVDGLLAEVNIPASTRESFSAWIAQFKATIAKFEDAEIECKKWAAVVPLPKHINIENVGKTMHWKKPGDVSLVGSWSFNAAVMKVSAVDLIVEVPKECLHKSDLLNHKYHIKRALYLAYLAQKLTECEYDELYYSCPDGNPLKPVLDIRVDEDIRVRLHLVPPKDLFKLVRLSPDKNNLRFNSYYGLEELSETESASQPTPSYNSSIAVDILLKCIDEAISLKISNCQAIKEAIVLLKIWMQQRYINTGYGSFSSCMINMFTCYLIEKGELHPSMSPFQLFRSILTNLTSSGWDEQGISLCDNEDALNLWKKHSDVVFVDATGTLNFAGQLSKLTYHRIQKDAQETLSALGTSSLLSFQSVFMKKLPFVYNFDHVLQVNLLEFNKKIESREDFKWKILNHSGHPYPVAVSLIGSLVENCLKTRSQLIDVEVSNVKPWKYNEQPSYQRKSGLFVRFGIILRKEVAQKQVEKCESDDPDHVQKFKEFWGEISELRRFRDGSISESVVFANNKFRLESHFEPEFLSNEINDPSSKPSGKRKKSVAKGIAEAAKVTVEDITNEASASVDKLTKILRQLEGVPLAITSVQGISPVLRYSNPFPTPPQRFISSDLLIYHSSQIKSSALLKVPGKKGKTGVISVNKVAKLVEPVCIIVQLESTGKWPDNVNAIERLKCALLINIGQSLKSQFDLTVLAAPNYLDVLMDGFVFRIRLFYMRELMLLKEIKDTDGVIKLKDNANVQELEKEGIHLPKLTSTLHAFKHQFEPFGKVCRLAKRWLASHLMLSSSFNFQTKSDAGSTFTEEAVELLVASTFVNYKPYLQPPNEAQTGFLRFLDLLANTDWKITPIIVNFNQSLLAEEVQSIEESFHRRRELFPCLFIATPHDKSISIWTKNLPKIILKRTGILAQSALKHATSQLLLSFTTSKELQETCVKIFSSPMDHFDVIIWLKKHMNAKSFQNIHTSPVPRLEFKKYKKCLNEFIPIVSFDPVGLYVQELRESFGHLAMFFYDSCGGNCVSVVWKLDALKPKEFSVTNAKSRRYNDQLHNLEVNVEGVLEAFQVIGDELVDRIEARSENWRI